MKLIRFDQVGAPIRKARVPSMGSIDQIFSESAFLSLNSSPIIEWLGNFLFISILINLSNALSKLVTGS